MKKLLEGIVLLLTCWTLSSAEEIDITISKGIDQSVLVLMAPAPASYDVDQNVVLKAVFDVQLDGSSVQKNNVKLKKITETQENMIDGNVAHDAAKNAVTFTPNALLEEGFYEVEFKSLKAAKEYKDQQIKEIKYRFYVPEMINGYKLPPEPDEALNNSTLLGIDVNENGVRDDVERYIIIKEANNPNFPKTWTAITLQFAWAWQKMIETPVVDSRIHLEQASACREYFIEKHTSYMSYQDYRKWRIEHSSVLGVDLEDKIFNTKERIQQRFTFNSACSGNVFESRDTVPDACRTNIDELGE